MSQFIVQLPDLTSEVENGQRTTEDPVPAEGCREGGQAEENGELNIIKLKLKIKSFTYQAGNSKADNIKAAAAGLKLSCTVCKSSMPDPKTYKQV